MSPFCFSWLLIGSRPSVTKEGREERSYLSRIQVFQFIIISNIVFHPLSHSVLFWIALLFLFASLNPWSCSIFRARHKSKHVNPLLECPTMTICAFQPHVFHSSTFLSILEFCPFFLQYLLLTWLCFLQWTSVLVITHGVSPAQASLTPSPEDYLCSFCCNSSVSLLAFISLYCNSFLIFFPSSSELCSVPGA